MAFSNELQQLLETKKGYRNEGFSGSGETDVAEVIKFEMYDLGNEDILDFFKENYGLVVPFEDYQAGLEDESITEEDIDKVIADMMNILQQKFGHDHLSCLWLTTYEGVKENYLNGVEYMNEYDLSDTTFLPVSDLEDQGVLFVLDTHPDNLSIEEICVPEREGLYPWLLTQEEFEQRAIPSEQATLLVQKNRAGTVLSKNKGMEFNESPTGDLVEVLLPIEAFTKEYLTYIEETVDTERVEKYQYQSIDTPIYALINQKGNWVVSDGGHRLTAKVRNEEYTIRALVPVSTYYWFASYQA